MLGGLFDARLLSRRVWIVGRWRGSILLDLGSGCGEGACC